VEHFLGKSRRSQASSGKSIETDKDESLLDRKGKGIILEEKRDSPVDRIRRELQMRKKFEQRKKRLHKRGVSYLQKPFLILFALKKGPVWRG